MSLNFPNSPTPGQVFSAEGAVFVWSGTVWATLGNGFAFATAAEGAAGVAFDRVMTPEALDAVLDAYPPIQPAAIANPRIMGAARVSGTVYQNLTGKPLLVAIILGSTSLGSPFFDLGPTAAVATRLGAITQNGAGFQAGVRFVVPVNWFYRVTNQGGGNISVWWEYRT